MRRPWDIREENVWLAVLLAYTPSLLEWKAFKTFCDEILNLVREEVRLAAVFIPTMGYRGSKMCYSMYSFFITIYSFPFTVECSPCLWERSFELMKHCDIFFYCTSANKCVCYSFDEFTRCFFYEFSI